MSSCNKSQNFWRDAGVELGGSTRSPHKVRFVSGCVWRVKLKTERIFIQIKSGSIDVMCEPRTEHRLSVIFLSNFRRILGYDVEECHDRAINRRSLVVRSHPYIMALNNLYGWYGVIKFVKNHSWFSHSDSKHRNPHRFTFVFMCSFH